MSMAHTLSLLSSLNGCYPLKPLACSKCVTYLPPWPPCVETGSSGSEWERQLGIRWHVLTSVSQSLFRGTPAPAPGLKRAEPLYFGETLPTVSYLWGIHMQLSIGKALRTPTTEKVLKTCICLIACFPQSQNAFSVHVPVSISWGLSTC